MSRIGRKSIAVPAGVKVQVNASTRVVDLQGPKGKRPSGLPGSDPPC